MLPTPAPGLVIRYAYLRTDEAARGEPEARKDRPCAIILTMVQRNDDLVVVVAPITHTPPSDPASAVPMPPATKARLGLDDDPSWIVTDELNSFVWPGPDIRPVNLRESRDFVYGQLPEGLLNDVVRQAREHVRAGRARRVHREP